MTEDAATEVITKPKHSEEVHVVDLFIEEYGDSWNLDDVRLNQDDGGGTLDVFVASPAGDALRRNCPSRFKGVRTIIFELPPELQDEEVEEG